MRWITSSSRPFESNAVTHCLCWHNFRRTLKLDVEFSYFMIFRHDTSIAIDRMFKERPSFQCLSWFTKKKKLCILLGSQQKWIQHKKGNVLRKAWIKLLLGNKMKSLCVLLNISAMPSVIHQVQNANKLLFLLRILSRSNICRNIIMDQVHGRLEPTKWHLFCYSVVRIFRIVS